VLQRLNERRGVLFVCLGLLGALVGTVAYATDLFKGIEFDSLDARFDLRGEEEPPDDIVVVAVDGTSITNLGRFPFPRSLHAQAIDAIRDDGAKQIAYDVQFTEETVPKEDFALFDAIGRTPHTVLVTTEVDEAGRSNVLGGDENLASVGARAAHGEFEPDDGVYRKVPFAFDELESFAVATVESAEGSEVDRESFDDDGEAWIDYRGGPQTFRTVSFEDVLAGRVEPGTFADKIVVVGVTASTEQDLHATPFSDQDLTAGAEIQANAIATIRDGNPLTSVSGVVAVLLILLLAFIPVVANLRLAPLTAFGAAIGAAAVYLLAAQLSFNAGTILPVVYPLLGLTVSSVGSLGLQYLQEAFERQRARDTFGRFVPEAVVGQVLEQAEGARLGGKRFEATVMFSDIRGFTTFSESRPPEEVIDILNRYLTAMSDAILDHGGSLIAYMGDGIMAAFGAPIEQEDHADRAVAAAKEMLGPRLKEFNDWVAGEGLADPFRMGIGLNTGPVMSGMVGSERRLEYTTIGDTVNTAARLEGMTKGTDYQLFVAESTRNRLHGGMDELEFVDELDVRGRAHGIKVWGIPGL
jgi:adenylate cyclase